MRIVFCGSGSLAVPILAAVAGAGHQVLEVFTQPPRQSGRGRHLQPTPVARAAADLNLPVQECSAINASQACEHLKALAPDVIVVADYGQFIKDPTCATARHGAFNVHASLLPELRGAAPINWAIIRGFARTGVTTFSLVPRMDAGDIYLQEATDIDPGETAEDLAARLATMGANLAVRTLDLLAAGNATRTPQDEAKATLAPPLTKADGVIDWSADAVTIRNRIHGTWPWPGAQTTLRRADGREQPVIIARAEAIEDPGCHGGRSSAAMLAQNDQGHGGAETAAMAPGQCGVLLDDLTVAAGSGRVRIIELKPAGKRLMDWQSFVNGAHPKPGERMV
ncbi:MAG: methionyl-tRNA formyltransferase [Planctomycetaceae bacterium]|nr:methionyl-tRNA formyltransferase [Planctomycetaceae bacterium]